MPTTLQLVVSASSHTGRVRSANQDAYGYSAEAQCFAVCDGMGGAAGGEVASRVAIESFLERLGCACPGVSIPRRMEQAVQAANRILYTRGRREQELHGMGTTLVALVLGEMQAEEGGRAWVAHVGDSRCYLLRRGELRRCTQDHSLVGEQVRLGQLTPEQAASSPMRNVITRAVGVRKTVAVEVEELVVETGDIFLLCSDGLTREVGDSRIGELLGRVAEAGDAEPGPAHLLLAEALEAGGGDNITCLTIRVV